MYSSGNLTLIFSCISLINSDLSIKFNDYRSLSYCQPNDSLLSLTDNSKDDGTRLVNFLVTEYIEQTDLLSTILYVTNKSTEC